MTVYNVVKATIYATPTYSIKIKPKTTFLHSLEKKTFILMLLKILEIKPVKLF